MVILTFEKRHTYFFLTERHYLTATSCQKIANSNTNIKGVYKYEFIFLFEDHFSKPTYFIKRKYIVCEFKICHTQLFIASGSIHDNISSLSITKNMQSLISLTCGFDIFLQFPRI